MTETAADRLWLQTEIAQECGVTPKQVSVWISRREKNGFPEVARSLGRYDFYDKYEIMEWFELYSKIIKNMRRKED